ncbi:hypothetical protein [Intestinirhabdus alba]|jgi:hypothetical protein|uniref:Uncharacterized protein n=1 Tax=Intestinirhabdus alba TaxID=2899544 RepID=A0A6L6IHX2_9ENTR|nr:hypothetical protein [Intestinirhabdus alba]MTH46189.1 hypothetical protein [Intestinirhabdus alba]
MSNRQIRRVNLSLHLSPEQSRADLRAMLQLKKWYGSVQRDGSDVNDANMEIRLFHRNIYLSGLQLHLLSPQLCSYIAESLSREELSLDALCAELQQSKLLPVELRAGGDAVGANDFSEGQLAQMRALMAQALESAPQAAAPVDEAQREETARLREDIARLAQLLESAPQAAAPAEGAQREETARLREDIARLAQLLESAPQAAAPADDARREETAQLREEVAQLKVLLQQQNLLLQQLRVAGRTTAEPARSTNTEEVDLSAVDAPTQKMNKVRQKGIF